LGQFIKPMIHDIDPTRFNKFVFFETILT
jgi:hypothetical protein